MVHVMRLGHEWQAACFVTAHSHWAGRPERNGKQPSGDHSPIPPPPRWCVLGLYHRAMDYVHDD